LSGSRLAGITCDEFSTRAKAAARCGSGWSSSHRAVVTAAQRVGSDVGFAGQQRVGREQAAADVGDDRYPNREASEASPLTAERLSRVS
jgi:hypothetical protein